DAEGAERKHGLAGVGDYIPPGVLQRFEAQANGLRVLFLVTRGVWPPGAEFVRSLVEDLLLAGPLARANLAIPCFWRHLHTKRVRCLVKRMFIPRIGFAHAIRAPQRHPPGLRPLRSVPPQRWSDRARRRPGRAGGRARIWSSGRAVPPRWGRARLRCRSGPSGASSPPRRSRAPGSASRSAGSALCSRRFSPASALPPAPAALPAPLAQDLGRSAAVRGAGVRKRPLLRRRARPASRPVPSPRYRPSCPGSGQGPTDIRVA